MASERNKYSKAVNNRGYTGHEHLPWCGLVNMNARLYDPALGRFLSPDPEVQQPEGTQGFNRYTYCLNNPLRYVDLDGRYFIDDNYRMYKECKAKLEHKLDFYRSNYTSLTNPKTKQQFLEKIGELYKSLRDLEDMNGSDMEFSFSLIEDNNGMGYIAATGDNQITIYFCGNSGVNLFHEIRHGGQVARGEFGFIKTDVGYQLDDRYGISHEVDAYRAQFPFEFEMIMPSILGTDIKISSIYQITPGLIMIFSEKSNKRMLYGGFEIHWYQR